MSATSILGGPPSTGLTHSYAPKGTQRDLFGHREPEVLVSGPAGTGKSRACLEKLHTMALLNPGMRGMIVRKTFASLSSTALVTWKQHVIPEALETGLVTQYGGGTQEPPSYRYTNGSVVGIAGMDKSTRIMSSEYDVVYVQEATELTQDDWEALTTRLRNGKVSFQQLLADCNPSSPSHWLKLRCDEGKTKMLLSTHEDNPTLFNDAGELTEAGKAYIGKLDNLTGPRKQRLRFGKWVGAEGVIYEDFDASVHVVDELPEIVTTYWAIDFGFTNPFVWQEWGEDADGRLYLMRELYRTQRLVTDHAAEIRSLTKDSQRPQVIVCDHDAEGRATLERALGCSTVAANKKVTQGIQATAQRMALAGDGKPRIFVYRKALVSRDQSLVDARKPSCTQDEIPGYIWDGTKESPVKANDHGCDAMRYMVAQKDLGVVPMVRWA